MRSKLRRCNRRLSLCEAFYGEVQAARSSFAGRDLDTAFLHLERAHILAQRYTARHALVHYWMLRVGWARSDGREVIGQLTRIVAALVFSRIWVPAGNTGGANVSAFAPMPIPDDLRRLLEDQPR